MHASESPTLGLAVLPSEAAAAESSKKAAWGILILLHPLLPSPPHKKTNNGGLCSYLELSNCPILAVLLLQFKHYFMFF